MKAYLEVWGKEKNIKILSRDPKAAFLRGENNVRISPFVSGWYFALALVTMSEP